MLPVLIGQAGDPGPDSAPASNNPPSAPEDAPMDGDAAHAAPEGTPLDADAAHAAPVDRALGTTAAQQVGQQVGCANANASAFTMQTSDTGCVCVTSKNGAQTMRG